MFINDDITNDIYLKTLNNIENKDTLFNKSLKLYKEQKEETSTLTKATNVNPNNFLILESVSFVEFKNLLSDEEIYISEKIINNILLNNKYTEKQIDILVEEIIKNNNKINYISLVKTNCNIFTENNIKDLINFFNFAIFLKSQKEIDFLLYKLDKNTFKQCFLKNNNYFTLENTKKFLNNFIKEDSSFYNNLKKQDSTFDFTDFDDKKSILKDFFEMIPLDDEILSKYNSLMLDSIMKNPNMTEEFIKKYFPLSDIKNLNNKVKLSKIFMKKYIKERVVHSNPELIFKQLNKKKDVFEMSEEYIKRFIKDKTLFGNFRINFIDLLNLINKTQKYDFNVYEELIEKREKIMLETKNLKIKINLTTSEKSNLFNENTSEEYYKLLEEVLPKPNHTYDYDSINVRKTILNYNLKNIIHTLYNNKANIPDEFIIKYFPYFTVSDIDYEKGTFKTLSFESFLLNQKLPNKLKTKELFYDKLIKIDDMVAYISQLETKEEADIILNKIKEFDLFKERDFYRFLFNNSVYLEKATVLERNFLYKNSNIASSLNNYKLYLSLNTLDDETLKKQLRNNKTLLNETDFGLSI